MSICLLKKESIPQQMDKGVSALDEAMSQLESVIEPVWFPRP